MESLEGSEKFTIFAVSNRWTVDYPLPLSNFCVLLDCLTGAKVIHSVGICNSLCYFITLISISRAYLMLIYKTECYEWQQ